MAKRGGRKGTAKSTTKKTKPSEPSAALNPPQRTEYPLTIVHLDSPKMCAACGAMDWNPDGKGNWAFCALHGQFLMDLFGNDNPLGENSCDRWFQY